MYNFDEGIVRSELEKLIDPDAKIRMPFPFKDLIGPQSFFTTCYAPLFDAFPDLERRDWIVMGGATEQNNYWVGCGGHYSGTFVAPWLDIPATGHLAHMRFHEFFRFEEGKIVEIQALWDIPELMMQANAWPMAPQLGAYLCTPGPMSCDGLNASGDGTKALSHIKDMETALCRHPEDPDPSVMQLEKYWHPKFNWYGPAGIGTSRGIAGFRHWHQIPFLRAMPDRKVDPTGDRLASSEMYDLHSNYIAQGAYVCETGWPNMRMKLTHDGWMGIAPAGREITLRSLDFWRLENGLIRENWVQIDVLHTYAQLGVDVLARLGEFNKSRNLSPITFEKDY